MNRRHTRADYLHAIERLRAVQPAMTFTSDFIIGFPGETEQDFRDTMSLVREVQYVSAYSFKYSPRPGTPAAEMGDQVGEEITSARLLELQALIDNIQAKFNRDCVGTAMDVLFEKAGRKDGQSVGRSIYLQPVHVDAVVEPGTILPVKIDELHAYSLFGTIAQASPARHETDAFAMAGA
jgi:tRNA-2-methylthio-N6-dimethylallyladenosine synthase